MSGCGEALLARIAKRKLVNFQRRSSAQEPCMFMEEAWRVPERFVARRPNPISPGWQVLVKWSHLGYDHCSWEVRSLAMSPHCMIGRAHGASTSLAHSLLTTCPCSSPAPSSGSAAPHTACRKD